MRHRTEVAPRLRPWAQLEVEFKESSRLQADDIGEKLRCLGWTVQQVDDRRPRLVQLTVDEVEFLAEREHGRWNTERLSTGWRWGEHRDDARKIHPHLIAWSELPEEVKEWDRKAVRAIPELLAAVNMEIRREARASAKRR